MRKSARPAIRELLRQHPDGLTTTEIARVVPDLKDSNAARQALLRMPDAYIDRWQSRFAARGQYSAVWCVVVPPPNCPYPTDRYEPEQAHA